MNSEAQQLLSCAITDKYMGCGATSQLKFLLKDFEGQLPLAPSGGVIRRSVATAWFAFFDSHSNEGAKKQLFQRFEGLVKNGELSYPIITQDQQNEAQLNEFDTATKCCSEDYQYWEHYIDREGALQLIKSPHLGEGKLLVMAGNLHPDLKEEFKKSTVRIILTNTKPNGRLDVDEAARRILQRKMDNTEAPKRNTLSDKQYKNLLIQTRLSNFRRNRNHWMRFNATYEVTTSDINKVAKEPDVYTINTRNLSLEEVHLGILFAYIERCPQAINQLLPTIRKNLDKVTTTSNRSHGEVLAKIAREAPCVAFSIFDFIGKFYKDLKITTVPDGRSLPLAV